MKLRQVVFALAAASIIATGTRGADAARPMNFVFILIDDLGWADVGCFGSKFYETPHIDRLASQGMRFTDAYAACAVCSPTRASIMTGKYPARLHITDWIPGERTPKNATYHPPNWTRQLPLNEVTMAALLKQRGYATASIGKWHLGGPAYYPEHHGFDLNIAGGHIGHPASYFWPYGEEGDPQRVPGLAEAGGQEGEYLTDRLTGEALKWLDAHHDKPFFLYLAHYAVHTPLMAKKEIEEHYHAEAPVDGQNNTTYAAMIQSVDEGVGRVLAELDKLGVADRTTVIFMSDNGGLWPQSTVNLPLRAGKGYPYEGGIREPLIIRSPAVAKPGTTCNVPVISTDFFPTICALAGLDAGSTAVDGLSLTGLLRGESKLDRPALYWHYPHYWGGGKRVTPYSVVRAGDWKLIHWYEGDRWELYNLRADVSEAHDLAGQEPGKLHELRAGLGAWLKQTNAQLPVRK